MTGGAAAVEAGTVWENSICPQTNPTARIPATQADTVTIGFTMQAFSRQIVRASIAYFGGQRVKTLCTSPEPTVSDTVD